MATYQVVEQRTISGTGILRIPSNDFDKRQYRILAEVVRYPTSPYFNFKYTPAKSRYAEISFMSADILIDSASLEYPRQRYNCYPDVCGQALIAVQCSYKGVLQSFANLGTALGLSVIEVTDLIEPYTYLTVQYDTVIFTCFADTAIRVYLEALSYDGCGETPGNPQPGGVTIPAPDIVSSGVGIATSPPYEDDTITAPNPIDLGISESYTLRVILDAAANGSIAGTSGIIIDGTVPDLGYVAVLEEGIPPGICVSIGGETEDVPNQIVVAKKDGFPDVVINTFSTCNFLLIVSQEYV